MAFGGTVPPQSIAGTLENISRHGALLMLDDPVEVSVDAPVEFVVSLSQELPESVQVRFLGRVVRVDRPGRAPAVHLGTVVESASFQRQRAHQG